MSDPLPSPVIPLLALAACDAEINMIQTEFRETMAGIDPRTETPAVLAATVALDRLIGQVRILTSIVRVGQ